MRHEASMRTTFPIDDDVLVVAKARAEREGVSEMARTGMRSARHDRKDPPIRNGIQLLRRPSGGPVTLEMVNAIRDDEW
jgi:hypothetical protein